jgi:HAE1 family hydrophobic/amphiphilic exporter-1
VRQSLGLVVLGGLLVSQLVTLYATPVFFVAAERFAERLGLRRGLEQASGHAAELQPQPRRGP